MYSNMVRASRIDNDSETVGGSSDYFAGETTTMLSLMRSSATLAPEDLWRQLYRKSQRKTSAQFRRKQASSPELSLVQSSHIVFHHPKNPKTKRWVQWCR